MTPGPKRGCKTRSRNLQDAPSSKKGLEHLNPRCLGEQYVLGGTPRHEDTLLFCIGAYLIEGMEGRMHLDSGGQERGHVYPVRCM